MQNVIDESEKFKDRGILIEAWGKDEYHNQLDGTEIILLGPQVSMIEDQVKEDVTKLGYKIPVKVMDKNDYGMMNATPILIDAFKTIKANKEN
jgi:PTS system cellobiose-specific IIB component